MDPARTRPALPPPQPAPALSRESFAHFSTFITRELGIKMPAEKLPMLQSRLQRRVRQLDLGSLEAYREHLFHSADAAAEMEEFINLVTTNKTDFFREPQHFAWLADRVLPEAGTGAGGETAVWCAGCSTGEEAYTLAMVLSEWQRTHPAFRFHIQATDISTRVLRQAREAVYRGPQIAPVPPDLLRRYFLRSRDPSLDQYRVCPELRARVSLGRLNFMAEEYPLRTVFDVIFFRNVMIYFDRPTQQRILERMCGLLRHGGHLFISHAESLVGMNLPLQNLGNSVYRRCA